MTEPTPEIPLYTRDFVDTETVIMDWLEATFPGELAFVDGVRHVAEETPENLQDVFPFVRVALVAGTDDGITDRGTYDIDVFAATRAAAHGLAERIRTAFIGYPHRVGSAVIDTVYTEQKPQRLPWDDENTRRFGAIYQVSVRR